MPSEPPAFGPVGWICANLDQANRNNESKPFKLVKLDGDRLTILHRDTAAVWEITCKVIRKGIDG